MKRKVDKYRRILSVALIIVLIGISVNTNLIVKAMAANFDDLDDSHWAYDSIMFLKQKGIINGYSDNTFRPNNQIRVNEFIKMLTETEGARVSETSNDWAKVYIDYALEHDWFEEDDFDTYTRYITREETAYIIANTLENRERSEEFLYKDSITDYLAVEPELQGDILAVVSAGIFSGDSKKNFNPKQSLSRAECSVVIHRIMDQSMRIYVAKKPEELTLFFSRLMKLEESVEDYLNSLDSESTNSSTDILSVNDAVLAILRKDKYSDRIRGLESIFWVSVAGNTPHAISELLDKMEDNELEGLNEYELGLIKSIEAVAADRYLEDTDNKGSIDYIHMIASLDAEYSNMVSNDVIEEYIDYLAGWGGDLKTFLPDMLTAIDANGYTSQNQINNYIDITLGTEASSHFSYEDLIADVDALNIATLMNDKEYLFSEAMVQYYYFGLNKNRYTRFVNNVGGMEYFDVKVKAMIMTNYVTEAEEEMLGFEIKELKQLMLFLSTIWKHRTATELELELLKDGFVDLINEKMNLE